MKNKLTKVLLMLVVIAAIAGCSKNDDDISFQQSDQELFDIPTTLENLSNQAVAEKDGEKVKDAKGFNFRKPRPTYWTLLTALAKTDLLGTVVKNRLTLFAPTDKAFAELGLNPRNIGSVPNLKKILLYHVIQGRVYSFKLKSEFVPTLNGAAVEINAGDKITVNDAEVVYANIWALNGVIHVIDKVLQPPSKNIVEIAVAASQAADGAEFTQLVAALTAVENDSDAADLVTILSGTGPFTVFAPTDAAFQSLYDLAGVEDFNALVAAVGIPVIEAVLKYHVVGARVFSTDLPKLADPNVATLGGTITLNLGTLTITDTDAALNLGSIDAKIVDTDIQGTNGVIHVIDQVILP
jgi:transforming growth factor-beta-induced protein